MAASRARLEALLALVQKRANEPRSPSAAVAPLVDAVQGTARSVSEVVPASGASGSQAPASVRAPVIPHSPIPQNLVANGVVANSVFAHGAVPENEVGDEDIEEYDDELIEIIDDAEVIPQAVAVTRAIEPAAFGAAVDRRPSAPIRPEPIRSEPVAAPLLVRDGGRAAGRPMAESVALRPEAVAPRPVATTDVARTRGVRRELRHTSFVELLDASLDLG